MRTLILRASLLAALGTMWAAQALAVAPPYLSDEELAQFPIIVVARWEKARFTAHHKYDDREGHGAIVEIEAFTNLHVERVISRTSLRRRWTWILPALRLRGPGFISGIVTPERPWV